MQSQKHKYKLTETTEVALKDKITPRILIGFNNLGLLKQSDGTELLDKLMSIYIDKDKLSELVNLMFDTDQQDIDYLDIDLGVLFEAYQVFFLKLVAK